MSRAEDTIRGELLIVQLRTSIFELSYLIIKHGLTVLEPPKKSWLNYFVRPKYGRTDPEGLLEIIQNDPEKLRHKLFLLSEIQKVPPPPILPVDTGAEACISEASRPESEEPKTELESERSGFDVGTQALISPNYEVLLRATIENHESDIKNSANVFSLLGKVWFIKFKNQEWGLYPDQEKYRYIACLLNLCDGNLKGNDSEYAIYNNDLLAEVKREPIGNDSNDDDEALEELSVSDLRDELSEEDISAFRDQGYNLLAQLRKAREDGNGAFLKKAQENFATYRSFLYNEYGIKTGITKDEKKLLFKVLYRSSPEVERSRQLIKNQINNAIRDFDRMPTFKSHLRRSLRIGSKKTFYSPESPIIWTVTT